MMSRSFSIFAALLSFAAAQTPDKTPEVHPELQTWECTKAKGCIAKTSKLVLDSLAHPIYQVNNPTLGCGGGVNNGPNATVCPDAATCAKNCIMKGISDYTKYGVWTNGSSLYLQQLLNGLTVSPRVYLLDEGGQNYEMLKLTGKEFSFDVDETKLPCGMNGALYLSEMETNGGKSHLNTGGAAYGTGYCDAQCFVQPFINGEANIGDKGLCCNEMDIWEANKEAQAFTPHTCNHTSLYGCTGAECGSDGVCDKPGCGYNPYGYGNKDYYGPGLTVNTNKRFTVVTQFPADAKGNLAAIRRLYVQDGKIIKNAAWEINGTAALNEVDTAYCSKDGPTAFTRNGGIEGMGRALSRGMVLIFSIWWDTSGYMNWLDSGNAGPCSATEGNPDVIEVVQPNPAVTFSAIKWGEINSTYVAA